jgi:hypothetical protein
MEFTKNVDYVVIPDLPEKERAPLKEWLRGQTRPVIEAEGEHARACCYKWDYDRFKTAFDKGQVATIIDW